MPFIFFESYYKTYTSPFFSVTTFVCLAAMIFTLIVPFFLCLLNGEFWITTTTYYNQGKVTCNAQYILYLLQNGESQIYNSVTKLNDFYDNLLPVPVSKISSYDTNYDGLIDEFKLTISFLSSPQSIRNIKLLLFFNYTLTGKVNLDMQSMAYIDVDTPSGAAYLKTEGQLNLVQLSPIGVSLTTQAETFDNLFNNATTPYDFMTLFNIFTTRNLTTKYDYTSFVMPYRSSKETQLDVTVKIPFYQPIWIVAPTFYSLKFAWIQYVTIMIPVAVIMYWLVFISLKYKILDSSSSDNLPRKAKLA